MTPEEECQELTDKIRVVLFGGGKLQTDVALTALTRCLAVTAIVAIAKGEDDVLALERDIKEVLVKWKILERLQ